MRITKRSRYTLTAALVVLAILGAVLSVLGLSSSSTSSQSSQQVAETEVPVSSDLESPVTSTEVTTTNDPEMKEVPTTVEEDDRHPPAPRSTPETTEVEDEVVEDPPDRINPWPIIGTPERVIIHTTEEWGDINAEVYEHEPERDENGEPVRNAAGHVELHPLDYQVANWKGRGWSNPGEEGFALLAAHQSQLFKPLANGGVPEGTHIEIHDDRGNVIHLETLGNPEKEPKSGLPWQRFTKNKPNEGVVTFVTCGDRDDEVYTEGHYQGYSLVNYFTQARVTTIEYDYAGERRTFIPG